MAMTIHVDVVSAEGEIYSGLAEMVYLPGSMGELGIAPRHAPLITTIKAGDVRIDEGKGKEMRHLYVSGGLIEVQPHLITILADTAKRGVDLDKDAAKQIKDNAEATIKNNNGEFDVAKAKSELAQAMAQLRIIESIRKQKK